MAVDSGQWLAAGDWWKVEIGKSSITIHFFILHSSFISSNACWLLTTEY
ncbi:MAG: hypothetical protein II969_06355 [Anaerolineaceae bacterium]|nr:hypothetical protein [Anaerolineaceae bacterium]